MSIEVNVLDVAEVLENRNYIDVDPWHYICWNLTWTACLQILVIILPTTVQIVAISTSSVRKQIIADYVAI